MKLQRHIADTVLGVFLIIVGLIGSVTASIMSVLWLLLAASGLMVMILASIANYTYEAKESLKLATRKKSPPPAEKRKE